METHNKGRLQMVIFKNKRLKEEEVKAETMERWLTSSSMQEIRKRRGKTSLMGVKSAYWKKEEEELMKGDTHEDNSGKQDGERGGRYQNMGIRNFQG